MQKGELRRFRRNALSDAPGVSMEPLEGKTFVVLDEDRSDWSFHSVSILIDGRIERRWPIEVIKRESELLRPAGGTGANLPDGMV